ncbi:MAG TPA: Rnase Y domain-containing protein, partial [Clostridia bacterium]|nr:Rnase Y domain-containing protein [Clostridia bacterium]
MHYLSLLSFFADGNTALLIVLPIVAIIAGGALGYFINRQVINNKIGNAKNVAQSILDEAKLESKTLKKEAILEAKEETLKL